MESGRVLTNDLFASTGPGPARWVRLVPSSLEKLEAAGFSGSHLEDD